MTIALVNTEERIQALQCLRSNLCHPTPVKSGRLVRAVGLSLEAKGFKSPLGARCSILTDSKRIRSEVVGFSEDRLYLMPLDSTEGLKEGLIVQPESEHREPVYGRELLGRVIDSTGSPLDSLGEIRYRYTRADKSTHINPLNRPSIETPLDVGVRTINGLLPIGIGQRVGLFAGSGVGKSRLLGMIAKNTSADVVVIALIGERGREVGSFVHEILDPVTLRKSIVVAAPADHSALRRYKGAWLATKIAEDFRDQGLNVLVLMDSLSRFAQAQREIGLAIGEPPTTKGFPPSVFQKLPSLVERAGTGSSGGAITGIYTVLTDTNEDMDPVGECARAVLDGHIVLSRKLAESGIYPAIDLPRSISRLSDRLSNDVQQHAIARFRTLMDIYREKKDLIDMGLYKPGADPQVDQAVQAWPYLIGYLKQNQNECLGRQASIEQLCMLMENFPTPG